MAKSTMKLKFGSNAGDFIFGDERSDPRLATTVNLVPTRSALALTEGGQKYLDAGDYYNPARDPTWTAEGKWFKKKNWAALTADIFADNLEDRFEFNQTKPHGAVPLTKPHILKELGPQSVDVGFRLGPATIEPYTILQCKAASVFYKDLSESTNWPMLKHMILYRSRETLCSLQNESASVGVAYAKIKRFRLEQLLDFFCRLLLTPVHTVESSMDSIFDPKEFLHNMECMKTRYIDVFRTANFLNRFAADKVKEGEPFPRVLMYSRTLEILVNTLAQGTGSFDILPITGHFSRLRHGVEDLNNETPEQHRSSSSTSTSGERIKISKMSIINEENQERGNIIGKQTDPQGSHDGDKGDGANKRNRASKDDPPKGSKSTEGDNDSDGEDVSDGKRRSLNRDALESVVESVYILFDNLDEMKGRVTKLQAENKNLKKQLAELDKTISILQAKKSRAELESITAYNKTLLNHLKNMESSDDSDDISMTSTEDSESEVEESTDESEDLSTSSEEDVKVKVKGKKKVVVKSKDRKKKGKLGSYKVGEWLIEKLEHPVDRSTLPLIWKRLVGYFKAKGRGVVLKGATKDMLKKKDYLPRIKNKVLLMQGFVDADV